MFHPLKRVMIVSYETLRTLQEELAQCQIGLLLADEGHRLKNAGKAPHVMADTKRHLDIPGADSFKCAKACDIDRYTDPE